MKSFVAPSVLFFCIACGQSSDDAATESTDTGHSLTLHEQAEIDNIIGDARVVTFGEPAHRLEEAHNFATDLFRYLVGKHGFRVLFIESSWYLDERLDEFMTSDSSDVPQDDRFYLNAYASHHVTRLLRFIREHNRKNPNDQIHVAGMHPENPISDARRILEVLDQVQPELRERQDDPTSALRELTDGFDDDLDFIVQSVTHDPTDPFGDNRKEKLLDAVAYARSLIEQRDSQIEPSIRAELSLLSLETYLQYLVPFARALRGYTDDADLETLRRNVYERGDQVRSIIVRELLASDYAHLRAMTWVHDWHAALDSESMGSAHPAVPPLGTTSFGSWMEQALGPEHVAIGSVALTPAAQSIPNALDAVLAASLGEGRVVANISTLSDELAGLLHEPHDLIVEPNLGISFTQVVFADQFDGLVYLPSWTQIDN